MDLLLIVLTYQRPKVLINCLNTLWNNTSVKPNETWILDDGSTPNIRRNILNLSIDHSKPENKIHCILNGNNLGIGVQFEQVFSLIRQKNPKIVGIIESDYIWRRGYMEDILAVFEANPYTIAIPATSHPDMYDRDKTHRIFPDLMREQFNEDVKAREFMYKPFETQTQFGPIKVQGVSNSCGCSFLHWERINEFLFKDLGAQADYERWMDRACNKDSADRRYASDGHMSCTLTWYWEKWAEKNGIDISKNFAWLDICDYSIGQHLCALGINGNLPGIQEGDTFVGSPVWPENFETFTREIK